MRLKYALFVLLFTTPFIVAQEEPLPAVTARALVAPEVMLIATAVEPIRDYHTPTLTEAARGNDYQTFDALYREHPDPRFATLYELWTYAMTNPIGSFYGEEMHDRLVLAYPGYAEFIDQYRIVDSRGNVFYPTSETRAFVLERAVEGRAPRVMVASDDTPGTPKPKPVVATVQPAGGLRARRSTRTTEAPAAVVEPAPVERRALSPSAPVVVAEKPAEKPAAEAAAAPQVTAAQPVESNPSSSRGILLIVIGLLGVGLLAVMFRTPKDSTLPPIINVKPEEKPAAPVEPLRRPEGQQPAPKNRATGSHG